MTSTKLMLVDDHRLIREGIQSYFTDNSDVEVVADTGNPFEALSILEEESIDIVILDINMPLMNGLELCKHIKEKHPLVKIIAVSFNNDEYQIVEMIRSGAVAYVLKESGVDVINDAIKKVLQGDIFYDPRLPRFELERLSDSITKIKANSKKLTKKELSILKLILEQKGNKEISDTLGIKISTINTHKSNLLLKTGSKNVVGLVKYALLNNILDHDEL